MPAKPRPLVVKVGAHLLPVEYREHIIDADGTENWAQWRRAERRILLRELVRGTGPWEAVCLMHELLHAVCDCYGVGLSDADTDRLAEGLVALVRDNPALVELLEGA